jgi:hypothetical protein
MARNLIIAETVVITASTITIQNPALPRLGDAPAPGLYFETHGRDPRRIDILLYNDAGGLWVLGSAEHAPMTDWEAVSFDLDLQGLAEGKYTVEVCEPSDSVSRELEI